MLRIDWPERLKTLTIQPVIHLEILKINACCILEILNPDILKTDFSRMLMVGGITGPFPSAVHINVIVAIGVGEV